MKELVAYLLFDGEAREAMEFYKNALGGELHLMTYGESGHGPEGADNRIMHSKLSAPGWNLMASDIPPGRNPARGDNFSLAITCGSSEEQDRLFSALADGGSAVMPLQDTFWGARFGMLKDRFGIEWMLNFDHPKPEKRLGNF